MQLQEWIAQLQVGHKIAVRYDVSPGSVHIQEVQDVVEPGEPFVPEPARERYVLGTLDFFDSQGQGWRIEYADETGDRQVLKKTFARIEPPTPECIERDHAIQVLEASGANWERLSDEQLRQVVSWLEAAGAIPDDFQPI